VTRVRVSVHSRVRVSVGAAYCWSARGAGEAGGGSERAGGRERGWVGGREGERTGGVVGGQEEHQGPFARVFAAGPPLPLRVGLVGIDMIQGRIHLLEPDRSKCRNVSCEYVPMECHRADIFQFRTCAAWRPRRWSAGTVVTCRRA